jgi:AcrR family transcriptional regulator
MTGTTARPRQPGRRRDPAVDRAIFSAAIELFLEGGVEGASFERISKLSMVARATIYRRWRSRSELLSAALWSIKRPAPPDARRIAGLALPELLAFLEHGLVAALLDPVAPRLIAQLIGSMPTHPEFVASYRRQFIEPTWQAMFAAIEHGRRTGGFVDLPEPGLLRDLMTGALMHRIVMRGGRAEPKAERAWVRALLRQLGLLARVKPPKPSRPSR